MSIMYILCSNFMIGFFLSTRKENHTTEQNTPDDAKRDWHRPLHERGKGLHPGALCEVGGRFANGIVSSDHAISDGIRTHEQSDGIPQLTEGKKAVTCCIDNFFTLVGVKARLRHGKPCAE